MNSLKALQDILLTEFSDLELKGLYWDFFGKCTPRELQYKIYNIVEPVIGKIENCIFSAISIGAVFGFQTKNGDRAVFKVYPKRFSKKNLQIIHSCQKHFFQLGYPAPSVKSDLIDVGKNSYGVMLDYISGEHGDGHDAGIRKELAYWLAEFSRIVEQEQFPQVMNPFQAKSRARLWPIPHKSSIRLRERAKGANFIKERALRARKTVFSHSLPQKLAHLDWGVKNSRFRNKKLVAIFDWDSLGMMSEAEMVGQAAAQFTADWEIDTKITPSSGEATRFVEEYQQCRGKRFTKREMEVVSAAADYLISLIARYEYAGKCTSTNSFLNLVESLGQKRFIEL